MVPVLNMIGTDVACVGVRNHRYASHLSDTDLLACRRTMISISASSSFEVLPHSASFPGSSPMFLVRPLSIVH